MRYATHTLSSFEGSCCTIEPSPVLSLVLCAPPEALRQIPRLTQSRPKRRLLCSQLDGALKRRSGKMQTHHYLKYLHDVPDWPQILHGSSPPQEEGRRILARS